MSPLPARSSRAGRPCGISGGALVLGLALAVNGCAAGASTVAASASHTATLYRSASAHVRLGTGDVFGIAVNTLRGRDHIEVTALDDADHRCTAVAGDRALTLRVIDDGAGGSRVQVTVGSGSDAAENQALADRLVREICRSFGDACDRAGDQP